MTKLEAFTQYMSQFAAHRGADMQWVMDASSHGRIFSYAWDEATRLEREACAKVCEEGFSSSEQRTWVGLTEEEIARREKVKPILVRIMQEAYDLADRDDSEGYNSVKVMCSDVLAMINKLLDERQWQGLTDDDIAQAMYRADAIITGPMQFKFAREIEAKLKEKNT